MTELLLYDRDGRPLADEGLLARGAAGPPRLARTDARGALHLDDAVQLDLADGSAAASLDAPLPAALVLDTHRRLPPAAIAMFALALAARIATMWVLEPSPLIADENWYHSTAVRLLDRGPGWLFDLSANIPLTAPPVVPTAYAAVIGVFGDTERWIRGLNILVGAAITLPAYRLGHRLGGRAAGLGAAALVALHPDLVMYSTRLWTEPIYSVLVWSAMGMLAELSPRRRLHAATIGALLGAAALTREIGLALPLVVAAWVVASSTSTLLARLRSAALTLGVFFALSGAWSARVRADPRPGGVLTRTSAMNLYIGNVRQTVAYADLAPTEGERATIAMQKAREAIWEAMPWWPLHKAHVTLPRFLGQRTLSVSGWTNDPEIGMRLTSRLPALNTPSNRERLQSGTALLQATLISLGAAGWALAVSARRDRATTAMLLAIFLATFAPAAVTFAKARFSLPAIPALLIGAGFLLTCGAAAWRESGWVGRCSAIALGFAALFECTQDLP